MADGGGLGLTLGIVLWLLGMMIKRSGTQHEIRVECERVDPMRMLAQRSD